MSRAVALTTTLKNENGTGTFILSGEKKEGNDAFEKRERKYVFKIA